MVSKLVAGREKDLAFCQVALRHGLVRATVLRERIAMTKISDEMRKLLKGRVDGLSSS